MVLALLPSLKLPVIKGNNLIIIIVDTKVILDKKKSINDLEI